MGPPLVEGWEGCWPGGRLGGQQWEGAGNGGKPKVCQKVEKLFRLQVLLLLFFALFSSRFHCDRGGLLEGHVMMRACERVQHVVQNVGSGTRRAKARGPKALRN